jgi:hypothetical protein
VTLLNRARYIGADISVAAEVAKQRFSERGIDGRFIQCNLTPLPFAPGSLDAIFSEGARAWRRKTPGRR